MTEGMIQISINCNKPFVWNGDDAAILRKKYRIVGKCVGCSTSAPYQYETLNLPVQIPEAAAKLLEEKGIACLIDSMSFFQKNLKPTEKQFKEMRDKSYNDQVLVGKEERKEFIIKNADNIIKGKLKKKNQPIDDTTREELTQQLFDEIQPLPESASLVQIFTEHPWQNTIWNKSTWNYPNTEEDNIKFQTYKHFWEKGYFITPGEKFGGDFLVYPDDPETTHSEFIAICKASDENICMLEIVTKGRLATTVKKTVLFCSLVDGKISTISLNWTHWS